ncbi:MAG: alkaline phosphatase [Sphingomonadaceae bacterium]
MRRHLTTVALAAIFTTSGAAMGADVRIETPARQDAWWARGEAEVAANADKINRQTRAKNVILFVGDGMGISTITAARIFEAQQRAKAAGGSYPGFAGGEENLLSFEKLPATALVKTYNTNAQVPDSAGTATAMTTGVKTRIGVLGLLENQGAEACRTPEAWPRTIGEIAREQGMGLGIVSTTRITHATPAAVYAHVPARDWEASDKYYPVVDRESGCVDIARQLTGFRGGFDVALGGGRARFLPEKAGGTRDDGRNLLTEWKKVNRRGVVPTDAAAFRALNPEKTGPVLGLFADSHIAFRHDRNAAEQPSLEEMTSFAVRKLQARSKKDGKGYFLMVEAGRIDHAHHLTNAWRALDETVELARAVEETLKLVDLADTLVLVTADHSHVFTIAGYPPRGNNILGHIRPVHGGEGATQTDAQGNQLNLDGKPMTTLGYRNGPREAHADGKHLSGDLPPNDPDYLADKLDALQSETHAGEDVALFAAGPGSELVSGTIEQHSIFHIMARALGWR